MFSKTGDGWFESHMGCTANDIVKRLRKSRRINKDQKGDIDELIQDVRTIKALEFENTLKMHDWLEENSRIVRAFSPSERDMKALRKFADTRKVNLLRSFKQWEMSEEILAKLEEFDDVWGDDEKDAWVKAMQGRRDAKMMWKNTLHQIDRLSEKDALMVRKASEYLEQNGAMTARAIYERLHEESLTTKSMTSNKLAKMLSMYGEEVDIMDGVGRSTFVKADSSGLILKDPIAYAAGFLDADGYISITGRGEPRAGFIATGTRGRAHCEHLQKTLDCGILQLDQKVYKDSQRSQHRLQFYSKADIRKLLSALEPHLQMKKTQARAVLAYLDEQDKLRKEQLMKVVKFRNWSDDTTKSDALLAEWGIDADTVSKWSEGL
tara:strand:+ start:968 stop:2104 length:1137 start_codon:yes stop_codon:yes gene_type:complete